MSWLYRFVWLSDVHIELDRWAVGEPATTIAYINSLSPSFVLVTGDLVHDCTVAANFTTYKNAIVDALTCPAYNIPGNHDGFFGDHTNYISVLGNIHFAPFTIGPLRIIGIVPDEEADLTATMPASELTYLETELQGAAGTYPIVVSHYPVLAGFHPGGRNIVTGGAELLALLQAYDVKAFLSGHIHARPPQAIENDGIIHVDGGAFVPEAGATDDNFMMVCDLYKDRLEITPRRGASPWDQRSGPIPIQLPCWTTRAATRLHIVAAEED